MARAAGRIYRRRLRRVRMWRRGILAILALGAAAVLLLTRRSPLMQAERIDAPTPTPVSQAFDQQVESREITLPEETWYAIQTGVFSTAEAAEEKAGAYASRGAPGTVVADGDKWRVFIACYGSEGDASAVRQRLGESQRVETYLFRWQSPELRLRLTGMAGQLDVVEAGLSLLRQAAEELRDTAILLDAGELTVTEASKCVSELDGRIALWRQTAKSRFGGKLPALMQSMLDSVVRWDQRRKTLEAAAGSATELSAAMKGQGMALYQELLRLKQNIAAG